MIEIKTVFTTSEAVTLMAALGFRVEERDIVIFSGAEHWPASRWMIKDAAGVWHDLLPIFREIMEQQLKSLLIARINRANVKQILNHEHTKKKDF